MHLTSAIALGELRGLLSAFAEINNECNHVHALDVALLSKAGGVQQTLTRHLGDSVASVAVTPLEDWQNALPAALEHWLWMFLTEEGGPGRLIDPNETFGLSFPGHREGYARA